MERSEESFYSMTRRISVIISEWGWMHVICSIFLTLLILVGSSESCVGLVSMLAIPREGLCVLPLYIELLLNAIFVFIWVSFVRFYGSQRFKFSTTLLMTLAALSVLHTGENFIDGPCSHTILNKARAGVMPFFIWSGAIIVNVESTIIPWVCGFLESLELTYNAATTQFLLNHLYTNETVNGTTAHDGDFTAFPLPIEEAHQSSKRAQRWGEIITYTKIGTTILAGGLVVADVLVPGYETLPLNEPQNLYIGIEDALEPLLLPEALLLFSNALFSEAIEYAYDSNPDNYYVNDTTLVVRAPKAIDLQYRQYMVLSIVGALSVSNGIGIFIPRNIHHFWCLGVLFTSTAGLFYLLFMQVSSNDVIFDYLFFGFAGLLSSHIGMYCTSFTDGNETWKLFLCLNEMSIYCAYFLICLDDVGLPRLVIAFIVMTISLMVIVVVFALTIQTKCLDPDFEDSRLDSILSVELLHEGDSESQSDSESFPRKEGGAFEDIESESFEPIGSNADKQ